jgi:hypothetical protein
MPVPWLMHRAVAALLRYYAYDIIYIDLNLHPIYISPIIDIVNCVLYHVVGNIVGAVNTRPGRTYFKLDEIPGCVT